MDHNENNAEGVARRRIERGENSVTIAYEKKISEVMEKLRKPEYLGSSGLSTYSPQFSKILENIMDPTNHRCIQNRCIKRSVCSSCGFSCLYHYRESVMYYNMFLFLYHFNAFIYFWNIKNHPFPFVIIIMSH